MINPYTRENPGNFANDPQRASEAGKKGGKAGGPKGGKAKRRSGKESGKGDKGW